MSIPAQDDEADAIGVAAHAAYTVLLDLGHPPGALMLVVLMQDGRMRIADGGLSRDTAAILLTEAPKAVRRYATRNLKAFREESH